MAIGTRDVQKDPDRLCRADRFSENFVSQTLTRGQSRHARVRLPLVTCAVGACPVRPPSTRIAQKVKSQELTTFREVFTYGSRFSEALYVLAGEKYHSARLRPRVSRVASAETEQVILEGDVVEGEDAASPDTTLPETEDPADSPAESSSQAEGGSPSG